VVLPAVVLVVLVLPGTGLAEGTCGSVLLPSGWGLGKGSVLLPVVLLAVALASTVLLSSCGLGEGVVPLPAVLLVALTAGRGEGEGWGEGEGEGWGNGDGLLAGAGDGEAGAGDGDGGIWCATSVSTGTLKDRDPALSHTIESKSPLPPSPMPTLKLYLVPATTRTVVVLSIVVTPSNSVFRVLPTLLR
jgi:hypothetical protein